MSEKDCIVRTIGLIGLVVLFASQMPSVPMFMGIVLVIALEVQVKRAWPS